MATINVLGMSDEARDRLVAQAGQELAAGDDRLARQLVTAAARQLAAQTRHRADQILTVLGAMRRSLALHQEGEDGNPSGQSTIC